MISADIASHAIKEIIDYFTILWTCHCGRQYKVCVETNCEKIDIQRDYYFYD